MIRRWSEHDLPAIQRLLMETWRDAYGSFIPETDLKDYFQKHYPLDALRALLSNAEVEGLVAEIQGEVVGFARTTYDPVEDRFFLTSLYVLPAHQRKGIGMKLLCHAEEIATRYGVDALWLGVMEENRRTLRWYERIGFAFVERSPFTMGSTTVMHLIGFRRLQQATPPHRETNRIEDTE